jgi:hypothetical protein
VIRSGPERRRLGKPGPSADQLMVGVRMARRIVMLIWKGNVEWTI